MPRLTAEQWERARAEYEVRGVSLGKLSEMYGVDVAAVSRRAKKEGWTKGKSQHLVKRKVNAVKELMAVDRESQDLPLTYRHTLESVVREQLEESAAIAELGQAIARKGIEILNKIETPADWETMSRGKRNLAPPPAPTKGGDTTVNVAANAQAAAVADPAPLPSPDALEELRRALRGE